MHQLAAKPLLLHVYDSISKLNANQIFVLYGKELDALKSVLTDDKIIWVEQKRLGTGHAVKQVLPKLNQNNQVLILCADVPLIQHQTLST